MEDESIEVEYPLVRIDKLHPDGTPRASYYGYRLPDLDGAARVYRPPRTRTIHVLGIWTPSEPGVSAFHPEWGFAPHRRTREGIPYLYVDVIRSVDIRSDRIAYVDLYLDVLLQPGGIREKDEGLLVRLDDEEAARVRARRDEIRGLIESGFPALQLEGAFWDVPDDVRSLPAKMRRRSRSWPRAQ